MATYTRVEATGTVEAVNPQGIKVDGSWWNPSRRITVDLSRFKVGDVVYLEGDETADGARRWFATIDLADGYQRPARTNAAGHLYEPDPDDLPDSPGRHTASPRAAADLRDLHGDRLACLEIAASVLTPWWVKKGQDPDGALLIGLADQLAAYVRGEPTATR